jgi:hypothetical protein
VQRGHERWRVCPSIGSSPRLANVSDARLCRLHRTT